MYFVALLLTVQRVEEATAPARSEAHSIHHVLTTRLHHLDASQLQQDDVTVALLRSEQQRALVRLTICGREETPVPAILQAVTTQSPCQHGQGRYEVESIDLTHPRWTGISTWPDLLAEKAGRFMRFAFATPLITAEPGHHQSPNALPFPEPLPLFSSLAHRWQALGGPTLSGSVEQLVRASECVVSRYRLRSLPVTVANHARIGYLGWIEYECRTFTPRCVAALNALARLAFFTGTGYLTAHGMGSTATTIAS